MIRPIWSDCLYGRVEVGAWGEYGDHGGNTARGAPDGSAACAGPRTCQDSCLPLRRVGNVEAHGRACAARGCAPNTAPSATAPRRSQSTLSVSAPVLTANRPPRIRSSAKAGTAPSGYKIVRKHLRRKPEEGRFLPQPDSARRTGLPLRALRQYPGRRHRPARSADRQIRHPRHHRRCELLRLQIQPPHPDSTSRTCAKASTRSVTLACVSPATTSSLCRTRSSSKWCATGSGRLLPVGPG